MLPLFLSVAEGTPHQAECSRFGSRTQPSCGLTADQEPPYSRSFSPSFKTRAAAAGTLGCSPALSASSARTLYSLRGRPAPAHWRPLQLSPHPAPAQLPSPPSSTRPSVLTLEGHPIGHSQVAALLGQSPLMLPPSLLPASSTPPSAWPLADPLCCQAPTHLEPHPCPCLSPPPHLLGFPHSTYH